MGATLRVALAVLSIGVLGCRSVGPRTLPRDHFDYTNALALSSQETLLMNLVRLRYGETPRFLTVSSVINSYSREGELGIGLDFGTLTDSQSIGGSGRWSERPTITYVPVSGRDFAKNLMTSIDPGAVFGFLQSGWPAEVVFRLTLRSINGVRNDFGAEPLRQIGDPQFQELIEAWDLIQDSGLVGIERKLDEQGTPVKVVFRDDDDTASELREASAKVRRILGLEPEAAEAEITYGLVPTGPDRIAVVSNSVFDILLHVSSLFEVPSEHVADGRASPRFEGAERGASVLVQVRTAAERPAEAFVAVRNRDYWFYIDDRDLRSKRAFSVLELLLNLAETGEAGVGPILSISN